MKRTPYEIHACERHVHKSAGVHLIDVCLRDSDFSIRVFGKGSLYPTVVGLAVPIGRRTA